MRYTELLKKLLPGLLPLIVFILVDEIWGTKVGLTVAISFGIVQAAVIYFKEKRVDKFVLFDTGLIIVLGLVSLLLDNDIFFKLKPALIGVVFCVLLGLSSFSRWNIMAIMSQKYMKDIKLQEMQLRQINKSARTLFFVFTAHTLLVIYSAFFMSKEAWAFISGALLYIILGAYFVFELVKARIMRAKTAAEEWLPLVDDEGKLIGKAPRTACHKAKGMLHPVIHLHIINKKKEIYLQKRPANKQVQPGKWDTAVGGHIIVDETVETALNREASEELGLSDFSARLLARYKWETDIESELVFLFVAHYNKQIVINRAEVDEGRYWNQKEIKDNLGKDIFTPNFEKEFPILVKYLK